MYSLGHWTGFVPGLALPWRGLGPLGSWLLQERIPEQVQVRMKAGFTVAEKEARCRFLETKSGWSCPLPPGCKCHRTPLWKRGKYTPKWMQVNLHVSSAPGQPILGISSVSKGGLFLSFAAPHSDSTFRLGGSLVPNMVHSGSIMAFVPLGVPFYLECQFSLQWWHNKLWGCFLVNFFFSTFDRCGFSQSCWCWLLRPLQESPHINNFPLIVCGGGGSLERT